MPTPPRSVSFSALDACHQEILAHLQALGALAKHIAAHGIDAPAQQQAHIIEAFFSGTSRAHHAQEEEVVFPALLAGDNEELKAVVRTLQQDHGWIEENWIELSPRLSAIAEGSSWFEPTEFQHEVELFQALLENHIALEETTVYPVAKAHWAQTLANKATTARQ